MVEGEANRQLVGHCLQAAESEELRRKIKRFPNLVLHPQLRAAACNRDSGNLETVQVAAECEYRSIAVVFAFPGSDPAAQSTVSGHQSPQGRDDVGRIEGVVGISLQMQSYSNVEGPAVETV